MPDLTPAKKFYWGASTSSHQVEGNTHNDWTEWERKNADRLAEGAHLKFGWLGKIWERVRVQAEHPENYLSGSACDHYRRFKDDFDMAKSLGHNAHRFSLEWSRIEPEEGKFDEREIQHYRDVIATLRERGLEPFVTLWHWTVPLWFRDCGGWTLKELPKNFSRYVEKVVSALGDPTSNGEVGSPLVKFWITLNETNVYTGHGYWKGDWPPGERSLVRYIVSNHHLSQAHIAAYKIIKSANPGSEIGIAHNMIYFTRVPARLKI